MVVDFDFGKRRALSMGVGPFARASAREAERPPHLRLVRPSPELPEVLRRRDPAFVRRAYPAIAAVVDRYFRAEIEGTEHLSDRASLHVSTHNGGMFTPDLFCLMVAFMRTFGVETPGYGAMHDAAFRIPLLGDFLEKLGAVPADRATASAVLDAGFPLLVCPGGDVDSLKPFRMRHTICFGRRRGFIRLALEKKAPIIPVVSVGAHETLFVLNDGRRTARCIGFDRLFRIKSVPLAISFPFGLTPAGIFSLPLPSKIRVRVLPPVELDEPPGAASDPAVVERCFEEVRGRMQRALDDLARRRRRILLG